MLADFWTFFSDNSGAIQAVVAVLVMLGGFLTWWFGLWGNRKKDTKTPTQSATNGGVIIEGNVHGNISTNTPKRDKDE